MVIMGIDPGTATIGAAVIEQKDGQIHPLAIGVVTTKPEHDAPLRIQQAYQAICALMDKYEPDVLVTERLFFSKNTTTAMSVGRTIGVILLAAAEREIPWVEYTPMQVKQAVVGYGAADKKQVQYMVTRLLNLKEVPKPDDAADAAAVAICHAQSGWYDRLRDK